MEVHDFQPADLRSSAGNGPMVRMECLGQLGGCGGFVGIFTFAKKSLKW